MFSHVQAVLPRNEVSPESDDTAKYDNLFSEPDQPSATPETPARHPQRGR